MATFRQWEVLIAPYVTGPSVPALEDAARNAAIELFQRTRLDTRVKGNVIYVPEEPDCGLPLVGADTVPYQAVTVWTPAGKVEPRTRPEIDAQYPTGFVGVTVSDPADVWGWISLRPGLLRLVPALSVETILRVEVAYQPKRTAAGIEDYLFDLYGEDIAWGAISRLMLQKDAPYYDPQGAGLYRGLFEAAIGRLASKAGTGHNKPRLQSGRDRIA